MTTNACWLAPLLVTAALGCADGGRTPLVSLEITGGDGESGAEAVAVVESGDRHIRVRRSLAVPADCRLIAGSLARAAGEVTLRVGPDPDQESCVGERVTIPYTATISGLRPGRYNLRVVHTRTGSPADVVLEHPVVVANDR